MQPHDPDHIWWRWIATPRQILNLIQESLSEQKTIVLVGDNIPWIDYIRNKIAGTVQDNLHCIKFDIDAASIDSQDIGEYLLHQIGPAELVNNFRPGFGPPIETYLRDNNVLYDKLIWIHSTTDTQTIRWIEFLRKYKQRSLSDGLFLIECNSINHECKSNRIKVIDYSKEIDFYDILSFSMMLVSSLKLDKTIKQYFAWSAALIFQNNIEHLANFIKEVTDEKNLKNKLDLFLSKKGISLDLTQLENNLWQAQMQIFFPIIEKHRTELIKKYYNHIFTILQTEKITWYDDTIENPYDVELGLLVNLTDKTFGAHKNPLYLNDSDYKMLHLLHESRNNIAHLGIIEDKAIEELLKQI
jgi:hypothetical protein